MATKKISELPLVNRVSGSQVNGGSVLPIVIGGGIQGTTNQISVEDFSVFVNAYNATTSSNNFIGTQNVTGDVNISGRLTVKEVVAQYETASILFSTGSTKLGDQLTDKHEFTGSTNLTGSLTATGFITLNGQSLNNAFDRIHQTTHSLQLATSSLQAHSASVNNQLARVYQTTQSLHVATASLQAHSASVDSQLLRLQQTTQSLHVATASLQFHSASVDAQLLAIQQTTQSLQIATASLNAFTASQDGRNFVISQFTSSTNAHIVGISDFTSSQLNVNLGNAIYTASVDSHIVGISAYTSSVRDTLARVHQATASLQQFTASQDSRNLILSTVTGSLIGITNGLMAFTAALDNTYATDAQLYQLYAATASINTTTGSLKGEIAGLESYTASLKAQTIFSSSNQIFVNGTVISDNTSQKILGTSGNILYLYTGTSGLYINNSANNAQNVTITDAGIVTTRGGLQIGSSGNDQSLTFGGTNSSIYWGSGGPARMYYSTGDIRVSSNGATDVLNVKNIGGILVSGGITGSLMATNGVISGSQQISNLGFATTSSVFGSGLISSSTQISNFGFPTTSSQDTLSNKTLSNPLIGSFNITSDGLSRVGTYGNNVEFFSKDGFLLNPATDRAVYIDAYDNNNKVVINSDLASYETNSKGIVSSSQQIQNYNKFALTASANTFWGTQTFSGSFNVSGSTVQSGNNTLTGNTVLSGSINISGSTTFNGVHTLSGTNTITGNTIMSGSIDVSGSSNFRNSIFIVTGSAWFTGSHDVKGNTSVTGSLHVTGQTILSGSINIASGSGFYRAGNKLFNYGAFYDTTTQSGSANVSSSIKFNSTDYSEGVSISNNTRIVLANVGVYNIQFSAQLVDTGAGDSTIHIWIKKNGQNVPNSAGRIFLQANKETIASWNYIVPATSPNDYYELAWQSTDADARILYEAATGNIPAIPSIILTVTQHA
jgi:prophage maintenance system killer protein